MANYIYYFEMLKHFRHISIVPKIWNYLKYRTLKKREFTSTARYTPQIASLFLTKRCNLNCHYCNSTKIFKTGNLQDSEATLSKIQRIFSNPLFSNCILVDLLGGEPLLVKELPAIISYLSKKGHITNISTNGLLLLDRIEELKEAGISRINISISEENSKFIIKNLQRINQIYPVHVSMVILKSMLEKKYTDVLEMIRFAYKTKVRDIRFFIYRPMGEQTKPEEIITNTDQIYNTFRKQVEREMPKFALWPTLVQDSNIIRNKKYKKCPQLWQRIGCDMLGNMIVCCGIDEILPPPNNNLFNDKPDIFFNHSLLVNMRKQLLDPNSPPPSICHDCNLLGEAGW